jgi:hypothetical protein
LARHSAKGGDMMTKKLKIVNDELFDNPIHKKVAKYICDLEAEEGDNILDLTEVNMGLPAGTMDIIGEIGTIDDNDSFAIRVTKNYYFNV